ncbi:hypothetical protein ACSBR2_025573 [Camellia fascicularis]
MMQSVCMMTNIVHCICMYVSGDDDVKPSPAKIDRLLLKTSPLKESKTGCSLNVKVQNGYQRSNLQSLCRDVFPQSPRKGRTPNLRDGKFKDCPSSLGPHRKIHSVGCEDSVLKIQEQQSATEMLSLGTRPPP